MKRFMERYSHLVIFGIVYGLVSIFMLIETGSFLYFMLFWNTILATVPLFFIDLSVKLDLYSKKILSFMAILLWFIFWPNSPYMVTDFIHITNLPMINYDIYSAERYSRDLYQWIKLSIITVGMFYAMLVAYESLHIFSKFMEKKYGEKVSFFLSYFTIILASYGIYIGRFLRFNSWDLLTPISLIRILIKDFDQFALLFTLLFSILIGSTYSFYIALKNKNKNSK